MKRWAILILFILVFITGSYDTSYAQCSICTRTAQQMGEKPAKSLNAGIIYLAAAPLLIATFIGYRWWKSGR